LPPGLREAVGRACALARQMKTPLYVAGGAVRDLRLARGVRDLDLVVEGDGLGFARRLADRLGARAREHPRFGTAALTLPGGGGLDIATARGETYGHPGALPRVHSAGMDEDLARRDFTINAMAISVAPGPPRLLDPHGGAVDLESGLIRMLHPASPHDDPTRAFRAALYANRLGFRVEPSTRRWIREAIRAGAFERVSADRVRREIQRLLSEPHRAGAVSQLTRLGLSPVVHPALPGGARTRNLLERGERLARKFPSGATWLAWLLLWGADLTVEQAGEIAVRLNLPRVPARLLRRWPELRRQISRNRMAPAASLSPDERLAVSVLAGRRSGAGLPPDLRVRGRDLVAAGIRPGPAIGSALAATRSARRLGRIAAEEELSFALEAARKARA
jgi:tRNA nucleotidyltransferase (CCA-adding enzyme)